MKLTNEFYLPTEKDIGKVLYRSNSLYYNLILDIKEDNICVLCYDGAHVLFEYSYGNSLTGAWRIK